MNKQIPDFCVQVIGTSGKNPKALISANGILVDKEEGWIAVNQHFLAAGSEHGVIFPNSSTRHPLVVYKRLVNAWADVALVRVKDPSVVPNIQLPVFANPPADGHPRFTVAGRMLSGDRHIEASFLLYPVEAGVVDNPMRFGEYDRSIMCGFRGTDESTYGLSGSPLLNADGAVLGVLTKGKLSIHFFTPAFEIAKLIAEAKSPSISGFLKSLFN